MSVELRHGLLNDQNFLDNLQAHYYSHYDLKRNNTSANPGPGDDNYKITDWKLPPNKKKTTQGALVMCLNLGIPPPDISRPQDCPYLEAFVNPNIYPDFKVAIQAIGKGLQSNYETISARVKYKQSLDPSSEDLRRLCTSLRRNAKDERILFHYNGHGVPQPTQSGEIWVFNRAYTQYIPVSLYDLQNWIGAPTIMVIDTSAAGNVIENNKKFVQKRIDDEANNRGDSAAPSPVAAYLDTIQLGACNSEEVLPMNPDLPADLFTCCLTTPIEISIKWFLLFSPLREHGYYDSLKNKEGNVEIPGKLTDRKTPLGELNWIFIAITDTIAWTSLSRPLFMKLFRQDLVTAALFRNFLLAKKIMPEVGCHPVSDPPLPDIKDHSMWDSWELAVDQILTQLLKKKQSEPPQEDLTDIPQLQAPAIENKRNGLTPSTLMNGNLNTGNNWVYQNCTFFQQHLTAFDVWLQYGASKKQAPQQLPIVLQVLLSQAHRLRALQLLSKFLDLGPWAVYLALSIGMCPYIQKLLQSPSPELKPILTFIWARIMSVDYKNTQQELIKGGYNYFIQMFTFQPRMSQPILNGNTMMVDEIAVENSMTFADQKATSAFVLSMFVRDNQHGQKLAFSIDLVRTCIFYIETSESPLLRQWSSFLIGELLKENVEAAVMILRTGLVDKLLSFVSDPIPEVRASIVETLNNFILLDISEDVDESAMSIYGELIQQDIKMTSEMLGMVTDGSPLIRREIICFFSRFAVKNINFFLVSAFSQLEEEVTLVDNPSQIDEVRRNSPAYGSVFATVWKALLILCEDPHDEVKEYSEKVVDYVMIKLNESELGVAAGEMERYLLQKKGSVDEIQESLKPDKSQGTKILRNGRPLKSDDVARKVQSMNMEPLRTAHNNRSNSNATIGSVSSFNIAEKMETFKNWLTTFKENRDDVSSNVLNSLLNQQPLSVPYGTSIKPTTPRFSPNISINSKPVLPLTSGFFDYSREYFQEPQLGPKEMEEQGSTEYIKRMWRRNRNESIIAATQSQKENALTDDWKNVVCHLNNKTQPKLLNFTQFEKWIVTTDERDNITTFDWSQEKELSKLSNGNPFGTKITDVKFLNEDYFPLLMTGSSDGVVNIYKNFENEENAQLITSWRALTDIMLTPRSIGLVSEWQQGRGTLLVTGDVKVIKVWDAPREKCVVDIPLRSTSQVLSMTSDLVSGNIIVSGFYDGTMRVYDRRMDNRDNCVKVYKPKTIDERSPLKNVHMQRGGLRELVSASANGMVKLWDIRQDEPIHSFRAFDKTMTTAYIHEHAPVIACACKDVDIYSTAGEKITRISDTNLLNTGVRGNPYVNALVLHPHRIMMATNHNQSADITIYGISGKDTDEDLVVDY
ncbi:ubiquitin-binding TORC1 subunit [Martiniozyma asiatica (nom. inval.)]|nr:ubiquitin-binding TORC1 subunit [Martiniozyma asiatica]